MVYIYIYISSCLSINVRLLVAFLSDYYLVVGDLGW